MGLLMGYRGFLDSVIGSAEAAVRSEEVKK
jgi:hypothetical protein